MEDEQIVKLYLQRNEKALEEAQRKYGAYCFNIARNILTIWEDAEECVNDAYLGVWNTIPPNNPNPLLAYVCRIVRNLSIAKYHKNTALKRNSIYDAALDELEECLASERNVEEEISAKELSCLIDHFLDTLNQGNRVLFVRRYWYSDSITDIAMRMKLSENNVYVRLSRIRGKLKLYLKKEGYEI